LAHHGGDSVLSVRAPGPKGQAAGGYLRETGGGFAGNGGIEQGVDAGLHAPQIQGYFNIPVDHLFASPVLVEYFQKKNLGPMTIVSPDAGGVERARYFAKRMDAPLAIVDKRRIDVNVSEVMNLIGDVKGRPALVIDDIIDTAGTLVKRRKR